MKVSLIRPLTQKVNISAPVLLDKGKGRIHFVNASRVEDVPSVAYRQGLRTWLRNERSY